MEQIHKVASDAVNKEILETIRPELKELLDGVLSDLVNEYLYT